MRRRMLVKPGRFITYESHVYAVVIALREDYLLFIAAELQIDRRFQQESTWIRVSELINSIIRTVADSCYDRIFVTYSIFVSRWSISGWFTWNYTQDTVEQWLLTFLRLGNTFDCMKNNWIDYMIAEHQN